MQTPNLIGELGLMPHPEGGYFREVARSEEMIPRSGLPARYDGERSCYTSIYYVLLRGEVSRLHRLRSDEIWCLLDGGPLLIHRFVAGGAYHAHRLGADLLGGERPHVVIPHGDWFGAELPEHVSHALVCCSVVPGFAYSDFELADRQPLIAVYPGHRTIIERLTQENR